MLIDWNYIAIIASNWRDGIEIIFFSGLLYYTAIWFSKDTNKNLVGYLYGYCFLILVSYICVLPAIFYTLCVFAPVISLLFIIMHQDTLQKNLITYKHISYQKPRYHNWLEPFLSACLHIIACKKKIYCLIEHTDSMESFLNVDITIDTKIEKELLVYLLNSSEYDEKKLLWINTKGYIKGINVEWASAILTSDERSKHYPSRDDDLLFTTKTDAMALYIQPGQYPFELVAHGKKTEKLPIHQVLQIIRRHIRYPMNDKKEKLYEAPIKKCPIKQRSP